MKLHYILGTVNFQSLVTLHFVKGMVSDSQPIMILMLAFFKRPEYIFDMYPATSDKHHKPQAVYISAQSQKDLKCNFWIFMMEMEFVPREAHGTGWLLCKPFNVYTIRSM